MLLRKYRWSRNYEAAEEDLVTLLAAKGIVAERWVAEEFQELPSVEPTTDKCLWCVEGSIQYSVGNSTYSLQAGDALDIPTGMTYAASAGFSGCTVYESPPLAQNPTIDSTPK